MARYTICCFSIFVINIHNDPITGKDFASVNVPNDMVVEEGKSTY
jgi:hypothetical protein